MSAFADAHCQIPREADAPLPPTKEHFLSPRVFKVKGANEVPASASISVGT